MDTIERVITYLETGDRGVIDKDTPDELFEMIDKLRSTPKYYLDFWASVTEFRRAKLTRSNFVPAQATEDDKQILITVHGATNNSGIPQDT